MTEPALNNRELKQTDAAAANLQIPYSEGLKAKWIQSALDIHYSEFEWRFACWPPPRQFA